MYTRNRDVALLKILSFLNLNPVSKSCGSFDRYFWGWKKKDFSDSTLQYALIPLLKAVDETFSKASLQAINQYALEGLANMTYANGSCDQSYPYENHPKTFLDLVPVVAHVLSDPDGIFSEPTRERARIVLRKGVNFSLTAEETYGVIVNHLAHDLYQYLTAYSLLNDETLYAKARETLYTISAHTHEEGWHEEYLGGDPGYQTRSLAYLTRSQALLKDADRELCESLCERSAEFLDRAVLPDGTLYSMFGSRNTALLYPSGIEFMAEKNPERFSALALRVRNSFAKGHAIQPLQLDFDNFIRLFGDCLDAQKIADRHPISEQVQSDPEPFCMQNFGLARIVQGEYSVYVQGKYGGPLVVYKGAQLVAKDGGFLIESESGEHYGTKNMQTLSQCNWELPGRVRIETELFQSIQQDLSPLKLIIIRLLNLTILRFNRIADLFRKCVVATIITGKKGKAQGRHRREIQLEEGNLSIVDKLTLQFRPRRLIRALYVNLFHMASSNYFQPADKKQPLFDEQALAGDNRLPCEIELTRTLKLR